MKRALTLTLCVALVSCAAKQSTPLTPFDQSGRVLDALNTALNLSTDFYINQKELCSQQSERCRFSFAALEAYRQALQKANDSFTVAVTAYQMWKDSQTAASEAGFQERLLDAQQSIQQAEAFCGDTCSSTN